MFKNFIGNFKFILFIILIYLIGIGTFYRCFQTGQHFICFQITSKSPKNIYIIIKNIIIK